MKIFLNGNFCLNAEAEFLEPGFLFGWGAFETIRIRKRKIPFLGQHIERLGKTLAKMHIALPDYNYQKIITGLLAENKLEDAYCRICAWRKRKGTGLYIYTAPFSYYQDSSYEKGFSAALYPQPLKEPVEGKILSYLRQRLFWFWAQGEKKDEAVLADEEGFIVQGSRSNIFFLKGNSIFSPVSPLQFKGITASKLEEIISAGGFKLKKARIKLADINIMEEAFFTSALLEVMPLAELWIGEKKKEFRKQKTKEILSLYRQLAYGE